MIKLERNSLPYEIRFNVYRNIGKEFKEKWKNYECTVYTESRENPINLNALNKDWRDAIIFIGIKDHGTFQVRQFPGLCGVAVIYNCLSMLDTPELREFIEELLTRMNYTVVMISNLSQQRNSDGSYSPIKHYPGFEPLMELNNRRTSNDVTIFYKQLLWK